jgi:type IV secretory pathway VirB3-like protein
MAIATPEEMAAWPKPNFVDPVTRAPIVTGLTISTMVLVTVFTAMRFYGKGILRSALGLDDWMMLVAAVCHCF